MRLDEDAHILFVDGGVSWNPAEIHHVDEALEELVSATNNTKLLKLAEPIWVCGFGCMKITPALKFVRQGAHATGRCGDNDSRGTINLYQGAFTGSRLLQTVIHEIGHNWDDENPNWETFKGISGWVQNPTDTSGLTKGWSFDGWQTDAVGNNVLDALGSWIPIRDYGNSRGWCFDSNEETEFARMYGHTNPLEDFATSFAATILGRSFAGWNYDTDDGDGSSGWVNGGTGAIPDKAKLIEDWLDSLSS